MDDNWLGKPRLAKAEFLNRPPTNAELASIIDEMRGEGFSYDEIQGMLRHAGMELNTEVIRTIASK